jgi:hypothetical protein
MALSQEEGKRKKMYSNLIKGTVTLPLVRIHLSSRVRFAIQLIRGKEEEREGGGMTSNEGEKGRISFFKIPTCQGQMDWDYSLRSCPSLESGPQGQGPVRAATADV